MPLETDLLLDRRRLKRRLVFWRLVGLAALALAAWLGAREAGIAPGGAYVARISVAGLIGGDRDAVQALGDAARDRDVKAIVLSIDSPGGAVAAGEALHRAVGRAAAKKPVAAVMRGMAASAGYMAALPAHRIFARESTLTGSIGVILETGEISGLLAKIGVTAETIASGPLKDQPSLARPLDPRGRAALRAIVDDMHDQFVGMVAAGRRMPEARVRELADGRAWTGRQALALGLIDAIGGEQEAREWLAAEKGIDRDLPTRDADTGARFGRWVAGGVSETMTAIWKTLISQGVKVDGPMAVWHPARD